MEPTRLRCSVVIDGGPSRRIGANGLLIGRQRDCDLVLSDPGASRRHALVRLTRDGAELVPLGRAPIAVNGQETAVAVPLGDGDRIALPGLEVRIELALARPDSGHPASYALERAGGGTFGISHSPFVIGGAPTDDLILRDWPPATLVLNVAQGELFVEVRDESVVCGTEALAADTLTPLAAGDRLTSRGETFVVTHGSERSPTTAVGAALAVPTRVTIEMLPRGGRMVFVVGGREHAVYLADRRFDLLVALLRQPGEFITDDAIRTIVWPRKAGVSRPEINMLISRCRRELLDAGLAGPRLLERAPGGGGTRICLAPDAVVEEVP